MNNQFVFESKQKTLFIALIAVGLLSLGITFFTDDAHHTRFWSNILHNSVFFTGIAFISLFILSAKFLMYSGWHTLFKRVWEAYSLFLIVGSILLGIVALGIWGNLHHLYHWADKASVESDVVLKGKSAFLNPTIYTIFAIVIPVVWFLFAKKIRTLSLSEDQDPGHDYSKHRAAKKISAIFLPVGGFTSAAAIWLWVMSVDSHWYSTLFAWYATASWLVSMVALTVLTLIYLKSKGYLPQVTSHHMHDLGKYLFGFSVFWTYLWFSQYMLIWYSNIGEETVYFETRVDQFPVLFYANLVINFALPFILLMKNDNKRTYGPMLFASAALFFGHWIDFFLMIKPGVLHTVHALADHADHAVEEAGHHASTFTAGYTLPGFLEIGTFLGFLGLFLYFVFSKLSKAPLVPKNDPYLEESLHHHVV